MSTIAAAVRAYTLRPIATEIPMPRICRTPTVELPAITEAQLRAASRRPRTVVAQLSHSTILPRLSYAA